MNPDDLICLCFHVSRRKVDNFIRVEKPKRPSQLSQCFGAGTGCGWCRPYLERLLNQSLPSPTADQIASPGDIEIPNPKIAPFVEMTVQQYRSARSAYVADGRGTPPPRAAHVKPDLSTDQSTDLGAENA